MVQAAALMGCSMLESVTLLIVEFDEPDPHLTNAVSLIELWFVVKVYRELFLVPFHSTILLVKNCSFNSAEFVANSCEERSD